MRQAVPLSLLAAVVSGLACLPMVNALLTRDHTPGASLGDLAGTVPAVAAGLLVHLACVRWAVTRGYAPVLARGPVVALRVADDPGHLSAGGDAGTGEDGRQRASRWVRVCTGVYEDLVAGWPRPPMRWYGATNPGEFFAVATEVFFEQPGVLDPEVIR